VGAVFVLAVAGFLYFKVVKPLLMPMTTIIFEPNVPTGMTVLPSDLQEDARILDQRWKALGYPDASFTVSEDGKIIGQVPARVDQAVIDGTKATGLVEFVDFGSNYVAPGTVVTTDFPSGSGTEGTVWHTIMTNKEMGTVSVNGGQNGVFMIDFTLSEPGKKILADFTSQNIGHYLGIVMDKVVIESPVIKNAITGGNGVIEGGFTEEATRNLAAILSTSALPIPLKQKDGSSS
jgi:preprotein translocase subunit SecD